MRRILLTATWLAGTLIATGVVYAAVSVVAGQVTEQRSAALSQAGVDHALQHQDQLTPSPSQPAPSATPTPPSNPSPPPPTAATPIPTVRGRPIRLLVPLRLIPEHSPWSGARRT